MNYLNPNEEKLRDVFQNINICKNWMKLKFLLF